MTNVPDPGLVTKFRSAYTCSYTNLKVCIYLLSTLVANGVPSNRGAGAGSGCAGFKAHKVVSPFCIALAEERKLGV